MSLNKYHCTVLMNLALYLYLYQCFNIDCSMPVTMIILKLVHTLCCHLFHIVCTLKKYWELGACAPVELSSRSSNAPGKVFVDDPKVTRIPYNTKSSN